MEWHSIEKVSRSTRTVNLIVRGAEKVLDFASKTFGSMVMRRYDLPDGTIMHVEFQVDDSVVMMGEASAEYPPQPCVLHVYVANVDEVYRRETLPIPKKSKM